MMDGCWFDGWMEYKLLGCWLDLEWIDGWNIDGWMDVG